MIHYANAAQLANYLNNPHSHVLSATGFAGADARTNRLWITDAEENRSRIHTFIQQLDVPIDQVLIKARIVSVDEHFLHALGVLFGTETSAKTTGGDLTMDLPKTTTSFGSVEVPILKLGNDRILDLTLTAMEQEGHAQIISSPELMTNNRQTAVIESGEEIPYQEKTGEGNTSVAFKKATLRLKVTPVVLPGKRLLLQLAVNQDKISSLQVNGVPAIRTQRLSTEVLLNDRETAVLGGIYEVITQQEETGVPVLRNVPIVGGLFRQRQNSIERKQLLIFVTPRVIHTN